MSDISIIKGSNLPIMPDDDGILDKVRLFGYTGETAENFETVQVKGSDIKKEINKTAGDNLGYPDFDENEDYFAGQKVNHDGLLFKFTDDHVAGAWNPAQVEPWSIEAELAETNQEISDIKEDYAKKDGYYSQMTVGSAENLVGQSVDSESYLIRPTGGTENEVANGVASVLGMEGNSAVWNQLADTSNFMSSGSSNGVDFTFDSTTNTVTAVSGTATSTSFSDNALGACRLSLIEGHKYYIPGGQYDGANIYLQLFSPNSGNLTMYQGIKTCPSTQSDWYIRVRVASGYTVSGQKYKLDVFDLTLFGIDNLTTVAQVKAWIAQHVGTKPYYAYNAGTILSAQTLGVKTYGQNLLNPTTKQAKLIPYEWEENSNVYTIKNVPSGATATYTPDATGVAETVDISGGSLDITSYGSGVLELSAATADTYVCMKWDEQKDNDVVPYKDHTYDFDVRKVYGKVSGSDTYVQCYPNGMRSAGNVHDTLTTSEAVVKIGSVDMGTLNWLYGSTVACMYAEVSGIRALATGIPNWLNTSKYAPDTTQASSTLTGITNMCYRQVGANIGIKDTTYTDAATFKSAMNDVMLNYELATPITYTDLIYRDGGIDRPLADVLMNIEVNNWSMEEQLMTPYVDGNPTSIPATIKTQYGMDAVEAIDTLQKTTYTEGDVHDNLAAMLACINTNCSEVLGGTFAVSDTATDKVFGFTFTPNAEPEDEPIDEG